MLFDLDGTLSNPKEGIIGSIQYALERLGVHSFANDDLLSCIGPPLQESFAQLLQTTQPKTIESALNYYRERFVERGMFENKLYEGIPLLLQELKALGYRLFIATSKPQVFAKQISQYFELEGYFERIYGSELDGTRGHKADLLTHILQAENLDSLSTVMIGDRKHDILGAKAHALKTIGVLWGFGSLEELELSGADFLAHSPKDILNIVQISEA
jgi:phosphoglycolate phosphatase